MNLALLLLADFFGTICSGLRACSSLELGLPSDGVEGALDTRPSEASLRPSVGIPGAKSFEDEEGFLIEKPPSEAPS